VDEAHYFLHDADVLTLLDLELGAYTLVTYRASRLHAEILSANQAIVVTRESDPDEVAALVALCGSCAGPVAEWTQLLGTLAVGEAVVLPITDEAQGKGRRIRLVPRLTPHVRHLAKYVDVPVAHRRAFVFARNGAQEGPRARTLREFVAIVERAPLQALEGHLRRGDFSRWVADVFGDYPLARELEEMERKYRTGNFTDIPAGLGRAVRARYEFIEPVPLSAQPAGVS
jgi:hypothetical protein